MEKAQRDHIIKNIVKLIGLTKNEEVWFTELVKQKFLTPNMLEKIRNTEKTAHSMIRETYIQSLKTPTFDRLIQSLEDSKNDDAANVLKEDFISSSPTSSKGRNNLLWFGMQPVTKYYKGREKELNTIHDCWLECFTDDTFTFVCLTGLGGIGKSELARKYAYKFYTEVQGHCIWINAENDLTFTNSFHKLANEIGISKKDSNGKQKSLYSLTLDVFKFLSKNYYLIVYDNLESYTEYFMECLVDYTKQIPPMETKPFVILTSRYQLVNKELGFLGKQIELNVLSQKSAVSFLMNALEVSENEMETLLDLQSLCQELYHLPLALQQAAAYINEMQQNSNASTEIKNYLKIFKRESKKLLEYPVSKFQNSDTFSKPTYLTWQITLDKLSLIPIIGPEVILTLNIISFLQSEHISATLLTSILFELAGTPQFKYPYLLTQEAGSEVFKTLSNYSMCQINKYDDGVYLSVHRLVQTVSQIKLQEEQKWAEMLNMLIEIVNDIFEGAVTSNEIPHIVGLLKYTENRTNIIVTPEKFYNLLDMVQGKHIATGLYQQGKMFSEFAIRQIKDVYGNESRQTLRILSNYGNNLLKCGELNEANTLLMWVYQTQRNQFDESSINKLMDDQNILYTKTLLATTWLDKGNYDEALKMYLEVLDVRQRVLEIDHPDTVTTKNNIALTHKRKGNYDEALKMYLEVLDVREQILGIDHPDTLTTKNNIAVTHYGKGNYDDALKLYLEVLEVRQRVLGIDHPDTLTTKNNIAATCNDKGDNDEALRIYLEVLDVKIRVLGIDHPGTLITRNNIAMTHYNKGNYEEALKIFLEVLEVKQQVLGIDHPDTLITKNNIALAYDNKGNYDEALKIYLEVLDAKMRVLGADHPGTLITMNNIALTYDNKGNYEEALKIYWEVLHVSERVLGIDHPNTLSIKNNIAWTLGSKGNYDEALKMYLEILDVRQRVLGLDHPDTLTTKDCIASTEQHMTVKKTTNILPGYVETKCSLV